MRIAHVLLFTAEILLSLCSLVRAEDEPDFLLALAPAGYAAPAEDVPDFLSFDAQTTPAASAADIPDFKRLDCPQRATNGEDQSEHACECGAACGCEDCVCDRKGQRTVAKPTTKLSRLAKVDLILPADEPPPRPELAEPFAMIPFANEAQAGSLIKVTPEQLVDVYGCPQWVADRYQNSPELLLRIRDGYELQRMGVDSRFKMLRVANPKFPQNSAATAEPRRGYPIRPGLENLRQPVNHAGHLHEGIHAGKFPRDWVATLSIPERESLHMDDHAGRVKWEYVPGHQRQTAAASQRVPIYEQQTTCLGPGRGCVTRNVIVGYRDVN